MLGSPNGVAFVYDATTAPPGSAAIQRLFERELDALGVPAELIDLTSGSDGAPFAAAGIPMGGVFSGAADPKTADQARTAGGTAGIPYDPCYHLACDDRSNVDDGRLLSLATAFANVALDLARAGSVTSGPVPDPVAPAALVRAN
jgi:aminopeptidase S